jgi:hypothetical protein
MKALITNAETARFDKIRLTSGRTNTTVDLFLAIESNGYKICH